MSVANRIKTQLATYVSFPAAFEQIVDSIWQELEEGRITNEQADDLHKFADVIRISESTYESYRDTSR